MFTKKENITGQKSELFETGFADRRGRSIGYCVESGQCDFVETDSNCIGYKIPAGHYFYCKVSKTKDGVIFGATQQTKHFKYEYQRDAEIKRRRDTIIKMAVKGV